MKKAIIFLFIAGIIVACSSAEKEPSSQQDTAKTAKAEVDGEKIYKQYCVTCHGLYGDMGASGAANLTESVLPLEERINVITNGRNVMTGFKTILNEEKIKAVAEYTLTLKED